jgi:hypothetical protein
MRFLTRFGAAALLAALLGSATPPHWLRIGSAGLEDLDPVCAGFGPEDCTALADGNGGIVAAGANDLLASDDAAGQTGSAPLPILTLKPPTRRAPAFAPLVSPVRVVISLPQQRAYVFEGGELLATSAVSTGKRGHETPVGTFRILEKQVHHRSNKYSNAPMPFMERLTMSGIALHAGHLPGYPASHGCIRFPFGFARKLYGITNTATRVTITRLRVRSPEDALDLG